MGLVSRLFGQVSHDLALLRKRLKLLAFDERDLSEYETLCSLAEDPSSTILHLIQSRSGIQVCIFGATQKKKLFATVQKKTAMQIVEGSEDDVLKLIQAIGYSARKRFARKGHCYAVPCFNAGQHFVNVRIYQLFEAKDDDIETPLLPPNTWIVEAAVESDDLAGAEQCLKKTALALADLVEIKKLVY